MKPAKNNGGHRVCLGDIAQNITKMSPRRVLQNSKTSFEKNCFSALASTLNMGLINKVDMVCLLPVGYGV